MHSDLLGNIFPELNKKQIGQIQQEDLICPIISNKDCKLINYARSQIRTTTKTIVVGLQLPNAEGELIRFLPREVTFITRQG